MTNKNDLQMIKVYTLDEGVQFNFSYNFDHSFATH